MTSAYSQLTEAEPVETLVKYLKTGQEIISFTWKRKHYPVDRIGLRYQDTKGRDKRIYYTVMSGGECFKLRYSVENFNWVLEPPEKVI